MLPSVPFNSVIEDDAPHLKTSGSKQELFCSFVFSCTHNVPLYENEEDDLLREHPVQGLRYISYVKRTVNRCFELTDGELRTLRQTNRRNTVMYKNEEEVPFNSATLASREENDTDVYKAWDMTTVFPTTKDVKNVVSIISQRLGYTYANDELSAGVLAHIYEALNVSSFYQNFFVVFQDFKNLVDYIGADEERTPTSQVPPNEQKYCPNCGMTPCTVLNGIFGRPLHYPFGAFRGDDYTTEYVSLHEENNQKRNEAYSAYRKGYGLRCRLKIPDCYVFGLHICFPNGEVKGYQGPRLR
eukprot:Nk52_evm59s2391 gene=Nk52_evmTU59s2391